MEKKATVIIGAGIVGLAIARKLAEKGEEVLVLEANAAVGQEASFRNSAVIHAGIYYAQGSLKSKLCTPGREALYAYCEKKGIPHRKTGKLIVATTPGQVSELHTLEKKAKSNGVSDATLITRHEAKLLEPRVHCHAALLSPSTGIVNGGVLIRALKNDLAEAGGSLWLNAKVTRGERVGNGFHLTVNDEQTLACERLINAAGLWAPTVSRCIAGIPENSIPRAYYAKGNYFAYKGKPPFSRPIYPIPEKAGLGIHATIDVFNQVRFGPDVEWIDHVDYTLSIERKNQFLSAIRAYFPTILDKHLRPATTGIRPKIAPPEKQPQDFMIQFADTHGVDNFTALYGIESPGLTASLAIADYVLAHH